MLDIVNERGFLLRQLGNGHHLLYLFNAGYP